MVDDAELIARALFASVLKHPDLIYSYGAMDEAQAKRIYRACEKAAKALAPDLRVRLVRNHENVSVARTGPLQRLTAGVHAGLHPMADLPDRFAWGQSYDSDSIWMKHRYATTASESPCTTTRRA